MCNPFEKSTTDSQPVGSNIRCHENHWRPHRHKYKWMIYRRVFRCQYLHSTIYRSCTLLSRQNWQAIQNVFSLIAREKKDCQLAGNTDYPRPLHCGGNTLCDTFNHKIHPNNIQSSLAGLHSITLNTTSLAPNGNSGKISCHTGE